MSKPEKKKRSVMTTADIEAERRVEDAVRAIALRRTGHPWGQIARELGRSQVEVEELAKAGYEYLLGQQDPDVLRAEVEDRLDAVVRAANVELVAAGTVMERNAVYRTILAAEAQRARLLGLNLKGGEGDAA
jgi:hypothetical protein